MRRDKPAEAEAVVEEAVALAAKTPGVEYPELASMIHGLAEMRNAQSRYADAETLARKAIDMHGRTRPAEHPETAWALHVLGIALKSQQKLSEAEAAFQHALAIFTKAYPSSHKSVVFTTARLREVLVAKGDTQGARNLDLQRIADSAGLIERNEADALAWIERAIGHAGAKRWKAATADYAKAVLMTANVAETEKPTLAYRIMQLAERAVADSQHELAEASSRQASDMHEQLLKSNAREMKYALNLTHSLGHLATTLQTTQRIDEADVVLSRLHSLASNLFSQEKYVEAEHVARKCLAIRQKHLANSHRDVLQSFDLLNAILEAQDKPAVTLK